MNGRSVWVAGSACSLLVFFVLATLPACGGYGGGNNGGGGGGTAPVTPTGLTATPGDAQVALAWTAVSGATSYHVKRSTTSSGPYTTVSSPTVANFTDTTVTNGTSYFYVVSAVNVYGESANSSEKSVVPAAPVPPPPSGVTAAPVNGQVAVSWTASASATSYHVKRATVSGGPYTQVGAPTATNFTDATVTSGTTYFYVVTALNAAGESENSAEVSLTPIVVVSALAVSPKHAELVATSQTQQFTATVSGGAANTVTWSVDGTDGGNATVGTISATGLYTPPTTGGTHTIKATSTLDNSKNASAAVAVSDLPGVFTYHNNLARDGTNPHEFALTPTGVTPANFGKLFSCTVDAAVYAQPLWAPNLNVQGQVRNVVFVATARDSVYAFDADKSPCVQLWHVNLVDAAHGGTNAETFASSSVICGTCTDIQPDIGVIGTPVIDPVSHTLYVVSKSQVSSSTFFQRLHALDLTNGAEKLSGPIDISATVLGNGNGSNLDFDPVLHNQRSALALANGTVYIPWASHEDIVPYHGWVIAYDANTLSQSAVYNATPNATRGGIWMSGAGPAVDSSGNVYLSTGNGKFDADSTSNNDFGDTVVKLNSSALSVVDWFTPFDQASLEANDADLAAGGLLLLPDQSSGPSHLLVATSKEGMLYLLNRDSMGHFCSVCVSDTNTVQAFNPTMHFFSTPAFWQNGLYLAGASDNLVRFSFTAGAATPFNPNPVTQSSNTFGFPGATPSISSQGTSNGVVWAIDSHAFGPPRATGPAVLHAYDATNLANELWNSSQAASNRDQAGNAVKFTVPTIANGKVYIGTRSEVDVYGLLP